MRSVVPSDADVGSALSSRGTRTEAWGGGGSEEEVVVVDGKRGVSVEERNFQRAERRGEDEGVEQRNGRESASTAASLHHHHRSAKCVTKRMRM
eukprot:2585510-Rhodomonas_salina.2